MNRDLNIHAGTKDGQALCGQEIADGEVLQSPYWDGVTCPACNEERKLFKTPEDLAFANELLNRL
jgi:hypothetical protein